MPAALHCALRAALPRPAPCRTLMLCRETKHPEFGTVMRMLKVEVPVKIAVEGDTTYSGLLGPMHYDDEHDAL